MRVFITGASGFIGSFLTRLLVDAGCEVLALVTPNNPLLRLNDVADKIYLLRSDISNTDRIRESLKDFKPESCAHLAWYAKPGKYLDSQMNVAFLKDSLTLLESLINVECPHVLMVGTCAEYDCDLGFLNEDSATRPQTLYAAAKLSLGLTGSYLAQQKGINFSWARIFYIYGPGEDNRRLVPSLITTLLRDENFQASSGEQVRDYLYVGDVASALWFLMEKNLSGIFNISSGVPLQVKELMQQIEIILDKEGLIQFGALESREWDPAVILGDNQKLVNAGWKPEVGLRDGLMRTVDWWK